LAAVIVEPLVQGAAGMWVHPPAYLGALRELARRQGALFIADEIATGFGRTGRMFACEHAGITPDLMCLGKGISGGYLPLAARLGPKIARLHERLATDVAYLPHVGEVRQQGIMVGIELVQERPTRAPYPPAARIGQRVVRAARARGVVLRPLGNTIVLMPPLAIRPAELDELVDVTRDAIVEATGA